jgi:hypothetical protein
MRNVVAVEHALSSTNVFNGSNESSGSDASKRSTAGSTKSNAPNAARRHPQGGGWMSGPNRLATRRSWTSVLTSGRHRTLHGEVAGTNGFEFVEVSPVSMRHSLSTIESIKRSRAACGSCFSHESLDSFAQNLRHPSMRAEYLRYSTH